MSAIEAELGDEPGGDARPTAPARAGAPASSSMTRLWGLQFLPTLGEGEEQGAGAPGRPQLALASLAERARMLLSAGGEHELQRRRVLQRLRSEIVTRLEHIEAKFSYIYPPELPFPANPRCAPPPPGATAAAADAPASTAHRRVGERMQTGNDLHNHFAPAPLFCQCNAV